MIDWAAHHLALIDGMETGLESHRDTFGEPVVGPVDFTALDYPAAHVIPDRADYQGGNEFAHTGFIHFYFERKKHIDYQDHLRDAAETMSDIMDALEADGNVVEFKPTSVNHYAGQLDSTMLILIEVEFRAKTLVDFADS